MTDAGGAVSVHDGDARLGEWAIARRPPFVVAVIFSAHAAILLVLRTLLKRGR